MKLALLFLAFVASCSAQPKQPIELGTVKWSRDLATSLETSKQSGKPIFLLFQEVPG